jgi:WD40 repeat protein
MDLRVGIVRILKSDGKTAGTGFVVNDEGLIATCAHVIPPGAQPRGNSVPGKVELIFSATGEKKSAYVDIAWWKPADKDDVAILRLEDALPKGVQHLILGSSLGTYDHKFETFGFPDKNPEEGIWGGGQILHETRIRGINVLQLVAPEVTIGFSGAPVLDTVSRRVVGMVTAILTPDDNGRMRDTAFITPAETLRMICPHLELSDVKPYLGLEAFTESYAEFFFGRRREVEKLLASLKSEPRFLAVLGPSGSGKSSVIQAGLIPGLRQGKISGSDRWGIITARPGDRPHNDLEAKGLDGACKGLAEAARNWLARNQDKTRLILIIDQFEELFTMVLPEKRQDFLMQLKDLLDLDIPITLILVMRDDFFGRFAQEKPSALFELVQRGFVHISARLEKEELEEIIEGPAKKVGLHFDKGLADAVVKDVLESNAEGKREGRSTILPLLEFALTELWRRRKEGYLTHEVYSSIGGVTGSLTQWADQNYQSLSNEGLGDIARLILTELVNLGDERQGIPDSKRRRTLEDFGNNPIEREMIRKVVMRLADARLITTSFDQQSKHEMVEIIHDSLIREWARLRQWLKDDRDFLAWKRELEKDAKEWTQTSHKEAILLDEGLLLRGRKLNDAERWLQERGMDLGYKEREFIQASARMREKEREKEERARTLRKRIPLVVGLSLIFLILAGFASYQWISADERGKESNALYLASNSDLSRNNPSKFIDSVKYGIESLRNRITFQGDLALRRDLAILPLPISVMKHQDSVSNAAFSPDGDRLVTSSDDNTTRIWDAYSGKELISLEIDSLVNFVAFSPDGNHVATASRDKTARIWDAYSGIELARVEHDSPVNSIAFSPDGKRMATASDDNTSRICDAYSGKELIRIELNGSVNSVAFSPDGNHVATASRDKTARIWDASSGKELARMEHGSSVKSIAFSSDGKRVATASGEMYDLSQEGPDNAARIWDASSGKEIARMEHISPVNSIAFSPDGKIVATASDYKYVFIWDAFSGKELERMEHGSSVNSIEFSPDGIRLATASYDNTARVWDVTSGKEITRIGHNGSVNSVAFSPDGIYIATASGDHTTRVWDASSEKELTRLEHDGSISMVAFSPNGNHVATSSYDNTARIWDASVGKELARMEHGGPVNSIAFSPDGNRVATSSYDNTARIWDTYSGKELIRLEHDGPANSAAFSPDGNYVATSSYDNTARIWDASAGKELARMVHDGPVSFAAFSPRGNHVVTVSWDSTARVWDASSGKELVRKELKNGSASSAAFSPDGTSVVTACSDYAIYIWDASSGKELSRMKHGGVVYAATFNPDGTRVVTASEDKTVRVWDASSGKELARMKHDDVVYSAAFSPEGTRIATACGDGTARIWDALLSKELARIELEGPASSVAFSPDGTRIVASCGDRTAQVSFSRSEGLLCEACRYLECNLTTDAWRDQYCRDCEE